MYTFLNRFLPRRVAGFVLALWYAGLVFAVALCAGARWQEFRYGDL